MGLAVMILSAWLIAASVIDRQSMAARCFYSGVLWTGLIAAWSSRESARRYKTQLPASWWGLSLFTLRWIAGIVLRKEALGMGDVLLFAALRLGGALSLPNVVFNRLMLRPDIRRYYKRGSTTLPLDRVFKSGRYSNTLSTGIVLMITTSLSK